MLIRPPGLVRLRHALPTKQVQRVRESSGTARLRKVDAGFTQPLLGAVLIHSLFLSHHVDPHSRPQSKPRHRPPIRHRHSSTQLDNRQVLSSAPLLRHTNQATTHLLTTLTTYRPIPPPLCSLRQLSLQPVYCECTLSHACRACPLMRRRLQSSVSVVHALPIPHSAEGAELPRIVPYKVVQTEARFGPSLVDQNADLLRREPSEFMKAVGAGLEASVKWWYDTIPTSKSIKGAQDVASKQVKEETPIKLIKNDSELTPAQLKSKQVREKVAFYEQKAKSAAPLRLNPPPAYVPLKTNTTPRFTGKERSARLDRIVLGQLQLKLRKQIAAAL